jgi:TP901 family phage tail tape measure protein
VSGKFSIQAIFSGKDNLSSVLRGMGRNLGSGLSAFARDFKQADRAASSFLNGLGKAAMVGVGAGVAAAAVTGAVLRDVVDTGADFEKTLIAAAAKFSPAIRKGTEEFARLQKTADDVGASTEFNAQQAAGALKDLASAGFGVNQAISALPGVVDLATAAEVDLTAASEIASKSLGAFGLKTSDSAELAKNLALVNDNLARTADATSASMGGLFETIKQGAPVAMAAGASVETFMALAGQLSEAGIEGSDAGTTLKNMFLSLSAPTDEAAAMLAKLGIKTKDAKGNLRDAIDILGDLEKSTKKLGTADKAGALEAIFGKIPIAGLTGLLDAGSDKLRALRGELEKAGGSTARMAAIMRDSTKNDIDGFTSAIDGVKIAIFGVISGPLRGVLKGMSDWLMANRQVIASGLVKFIEDVKENLPQIVFWGTKLGIIIGVLGGIALGVKAVTTAMGIWTAVMALNPVVATIMGIAAALALLIAFWPEITKHFIDVWAGIKAAFQQGFVQGVWEVLKQLFIHFSPVVWIAKGLDALLEYLFGFSLLDAGESLIDSLIDGLASAWNLVTTFFGAAWDAVANAFMTVWTPIKNVAVAGIEFLVGLWTLYIRGVLFVLSPFIQFWGFILGQVRDLFVAIWEEIVSFAAFAVELLKFVCVPLALFFSELWNGAGAFFRSTWEGIVAFASGIVERFKKIWNPLKAWFGELWEFIVTLFREKLGPVIDSIQSVIDAVRSVGRDTLGAGEPAGDGAGQSSEPPPDYTPVSFVPRHAIGPEEAGAKFYSETLETQRGEVVIRDETGRAEIRKPFKKEGGLRMLRTGEIFL